MRKLKIRNDFLIFFLLLAFFACSIFCCFPKVSYAQEEMPSQFETDISTLTIGDQATSGLTNLCWAFSASKMVETFFFTKKENTINISESWISLAYMYYVNDPDTELLTKENRAEDCYEAVDNENYRYKGYGNVYEFQRVINAYGVMFEGDGVWQCPLTISVDCDNPGSDDYYTKVFDKYKSFASSNKPLMQNLKFQSIVSYNSSYIKGDNNKQLDNIVRFIKDYLYNYSALSTYVCPNYQNYNDERFVFYQDRENTACSHALTIVGYDDEKEFSYEGVKYVGAFKLIDSYGEENKDVWIPYEMYRPIINDNTECNRILSNTYYIKNITLSDKTTYNNVCTIASATNFGGFLGTIERFVDSLGDNGLVKFLLIVVVGVLVIVGLVILVSALIRKKSTSSNNKNVLTKSIADYQAQQEDIERQRKELDDFMKQKRYEDYKRKQRQLKRKFQQTLDEMNKPDGNDDAK